ncbi:hypothetical protein VTK73DRAFT_434 [Phialemonium thermophilum]|uniref:Uncharacterized protein n=1 Tax=Phialemonium thermophilum TaxID=223376 RepID=A0ABR3XEK8_9PEZI
MRSFLALPLAAMFLAWNVSALPSLDSPFPEFAALQARQAPGSPEYECHADCGYTILDASIQGHCDNSTWKGLLQDCLECANKFDIWQYYGNGVQSAAQGCGLTAVPSPASTAGGSTAPVTTASPSPSETATPPPVTVSSGSASAGGGSSTSAAAGSGASSAPGSSAAVSSASVPASSELSATASVTAPPSSSAGSASGTGAIPPSSSPSLATISGAGRKGVPSLLVLGLAILAWFA